MTLKCLSVSFKNRKNIIMIGGVKMYQKIIEEEDTIYELDEDCVNKQKEERENQSYGETQRKRETKEK